MNEPIFIPLSRVFANPFQPREKEDPEHVQRIALSIAERGLLQIPIGRLALNGKALDPEAYGGVSPALHDEMDARVQLAFGHTRLAAFRWLVETGHPGSWDKLPVIVRHLSDEEMFELALRENLERRDLTPIEVGRAMQTYRDTFHKSSIEIGKLFGLSDSAVRNKMRLLGLPEAVQAKVSSGELPENTARSLLTVQRLAPEKVTEMATQIAEGGFTTADEVSIVISRTMSNRDGVHTMFNMYDKGTPAGGIGLWPLTWAPTGCGMSPKKICEVLGEQWVDDERVKNVGGSFLKLVETIIKCIGTSQPSDWPDTLHEQVATLYQPPACTACPFYAANGGNHYCGLKPCHSMKKKAWMDSELARLSQELNIAIFDPKADGKVYEDYAGWGESKKKFEKWFAERADHLRLRSHYDTYQADPFTKSHCVELISVNEEHRKKAEKEKEKASKEKAEAKTEEQRREEEQKNRKAADAFLAEIAVPIFAHAFDSIPEGVLKDMSYAFNRWTDIEDGKSAITQYVLNQAYDWKLRSLGPQHIATLLVEKAKAWGVTLPGNWDEYTE
jgi:ParB/RepB/Spo0J family partition protein